MWEGISWRKKTHGTKSGFFLFRREISVSIFSLRMVLLFEAKCNQLVAAYMKLIPHLDMLATFREDLRPIHFFLYRPQNRGNPIKIHENTWKWALVGFFLYNKAIGRSPAFFRFVEKYRFPFSVWGRWYFLSQFATSLGLRMKLIPHLGICVGYLWGKFELCRPIIFWDIGLKTEVTP